MLLPSRSKHTDDWVRQNYSKATLQLRFIAMFSCSEGGEKFWREYERRQGSENGIENGPMLLMDVETFENAHYLQ